MMSKKRNKRQPQNQELQLQDNKVQLKTDNDVVIFSMEQTKLSSIYGKTVDNDTQNKISSIISPIISQMPNIAKNVQGLQSYEAVFSPQMKELLKSGTAVIHMDNQGELLPQIIHTGTDGKKGQIIKKVRLKSGMTPANIALIGWQIASTITAQKHLSDINEKLTVISKDIKDIKGFLEDEFFSQIEARIRATINLMTAISKNPNFIQEQEFKELHAQNLGANMENTDKLIARLDKMIGNKITEFSQEVFKEKGDIDKTVKKYQNKVQEIADLINLSLQLIQVQHILCMIYAFYAENTNYAETWRKSLNEHQNILKEKIKEFEKIAKEKVDKLDYKIPLWKFTPIGAIADIIDDVPITIARINKTINIPKDINRSDHKFGSSIKNTLHTHKVKKSQKSKISSQFNDLNLSVNQLFNDMQKQFNSLNSEHRVIIDLNNGEIENIRLLE